MALALYRKYRPRTFAEVIGQEHVTEPLSQALRSGRLHHAYLFSGPRGCGKTSSARILARSLNCEQGPTPEPCGVCQSCRSLTNDGVGSIDVIEIDAASHGGVDDARELREKAFYAPANSRYKIYVIDEAHMVSSAGFNALLKLVEEPPEYVKFIFATTEPEKVLGTIRSRTHHYPFRLIPPAILRPYLQQLTEAEGVHVEPAVFPLVVRSGGGSARDSLSVLDQLIAGAGPDGVSYARAVALLGVTDVTLIDEMCDALAAGDGAAAYSTIDRVAEAGHDPRRFASDLLERFRDLIILQQVPDAMTKGLIDGPTDQLEAMSAQATRLGPATLSRCADIVHNGLVEMRGTTAPRLLLELVTARMLLPGADDSTGALLQRMERMERRLTLGGDAPAAVRTEAAPPAVAAAQVSAVSAVSPVSAAPAVPAASAASAEAAGGSEGGGLSAARAAAAAASRRSPTTAVRRPAEAASAPAPAPAPAAPAGPASVSAPAAGSPAAGSSAAAVAPSREPDHYDDEPPWDDEPEPDAYESEPVPAGGPNAAAGEVTDRRSEPDAHPEPARDKSVVVGNSGRQAETGHQAEPAEPQRRAVSDPGLEPVVAGQPQRTVERGSRAEPVEGVQAQRRDEPGSQVEPGVSAQQRPQAEPDVSAQPERRAEVESRVGPVVSAQPERRAEPGRSEPRGVLPDAPEESGAAAVEPPPGQLTVAAVREVWPEIVTAIGRQSKRLAALLAGAVVRDLDGQTVVLTFRYPKHAEMVAPAAPAVASALYEALGGKWDIRCEAAGEAGAAAVAPAPRGGSSRPSDGPGPAGPPAARLNDGPGSASPPPAARPGSASQPAGRSSDGAGSAGSPAGRSSDGAGSAGPPAGRDQPRNESAAASAVRSGRPAQPAPGAQQAHAAAPRPPQSRRQETEASSSAGDDDWPEPAKPGGLGPPGSSAVPEPPADEEEDWPEVSPIGMASDPGTARNDAAPERGGDLQDAASSSANLGAGRSASPVGAGSEAARTAAPSAPGSSGADGSGAVRSTDAVTTSASAGAAAVDAMRAIHLTAPLSGGAAGAAGPDAERVAHPTAPSSGGAGLSGPDAAGVAPPAAPPSGGAGVAGATGTSSAGGPGATAQAGAGAAGAGGAQRAGRNAGPGSGLAAARAAAAGARTTAAARQSGAQPAAATPSPGGQAPGAWSDGSPTEEAPYDPEFDGPPPAGAPPRAATSSYEGFDPGDEPLDEVIDEKTARESSEQQAMRLLQEVLGAEKIGES